MPNKIDALFKEMVDFGASDLHLAEGQPPKIRTAAGADAKPAQSVTAAAAANDAAMPPPLARRCN